MMEKKGKVTFIHSISFRIMILVVCIVAYSLFGSIFSANSKTKKIIGQTNENYILSLAELGAQALSNVSPEQVDSEDYMGVMQGIEMKGIDSAYAYLVDADGMMLYHPATEKIG